MKLFLKSNIMILFYMILCACIAQSNFNSTSNQELKSVLMLQGTWEGEGDIESYMIFDGRVNYSVVNFNGNVIVRKRLYGFLESVPGDSIDIRNLKDGGTHFVIFTGKYEQGRFTYNSHSDFNSYSYDLDRDYFIYYANDPVTLNKIDSLPEDIQKIFKRKKVELDKIKFFENQE